MDPVDLLLVGHSGIQPHESLESNGLLDCSSGVKDVLLVVVVVSSSSSSRRRRSFQKCIYVI